MGPKWYINKNMNLASGAILYTLLFLATYVQVFFLITFFENRKKIVIRTGETKLKHYPAVTILVACWNEEKTVYKTVRSLLAMHYPKDKLKIFLVDDGSTDGTWKILQKFEKYQNVKIFQKENGGKYTALNWGLKNLETEFFGGLDADSIADSYALVRIMSYFENDPEAMAVVPSVSINNPKNYIQGAQHAEYHMGIYTKKMLGFMGAINVTPGPLTIFRKKVFDDLGPYVHGHNTEDMEIAYRMQAHDYKIEHCNDAYVYTNSPATIKKLFKQRLRWIYGFINNTIDYRRVLFRKKYGNFGLFTLPTGVVSIFAVSYLFFRVMSDFAHFILSKTQQFHTIGWNFSAPSYELDPFFFNAQASLFILVIIYSLVIFAIIFGRRMVEQKWVFSINMLYFLLVFRVLAPIWFLKALYNTILKRTPAWR